MRGSGDTSTRKTLSLPARYLQYTEGWMEATVSVKPDASQVRAREGNCILEDLDSILDSSFCSAIIYLPGIWCVSGHW